MNKTLRSLSLTLLAAMPFAASAAVGTGVDPVQVTVARCSVVDLGAFQAFIGGKPSVAEFRAAYTCVQLVLPGDMSTNEMRSDNSRYFADLDAHGRIIGGVFQ